MKSTAPSHWARHSILWVFCLFASQPAALGQDEGSWQSALLDESGRRLTPPLTSRGKPAAGKRVAITPAQYDGSEVHHMLYLPGDWTPDWKASKKRWPVIVEYTGNRYIAAGSTGKVKDAGLGFGITGGHFIWVTLPFVNEDHSGNAVQWWGDLKATVAYAKTELPRICQHFGGDADSVFLCGFSRGAIAASYVGLHDDEIASLWKGMITHDHFDGVREWRGTKWGSPLERYRREAVKRLTRIGNRPVFICDSDSIRETALFLRKAAPEANATFLEVDTRSILRDFPNAIAIHPHNDRWLLVPSDKRLRLRKWLLRALSEDATKPTSSPTTGR